MINIEPLGPSDDSNFLTHLMTPQLRGRKPVQVYKCVDMQGTERAAKQVFTANPEILDTEIEIHRFSSGGVPCEELSLGLVGLLNMSSLWEMVDSPM